MVFSFIIRGIISQKESSINTMFLFILTTVHVAIAKLKIINLWSKNPVSLLARWDTGGSEDTIYKIIMRMDDVRPTVFDFIYYHKRIGYDYKLIKAHVLSAISKVEDKN